MNPGIEKFWKRTGKEIWSYSAEKHQIWFLCSDLAYYSQGGPPPPWPQDVLCILSKETKLKRYYFEGKTYPENEMLKIVKNKMFI